MRVLGFEGFRGLGFMGFRVLGFRGLGFRCRSVGFWGLGV